MLYLHPAGGTPSSSVLETRFDHLAGAKQFVVAFPPSAGPYWDVAVTEGTTDSDVDERYLAALIDRLIDDLPIDPDRVYVTGFSMGAVMADRVACRLTDRVKAAVIVSGTSWVGGPCKPSRPISVAIVHGSGDSTFPYEAAEKQADQWRARDGCATPGAAEPLGDSATISRATGCRDGTSVEFVTVKGGGHSWFGQPDATTFAWEFFEGAARRCAAVAARSRDAHPGLRDPRAPGARTDDRVRDEPATARPDRSLLAGPPQPDLPDPVAPRGRRLDDLPPDAGARAATDSRQAITGAGLDALRSWVSSPPERRSNRDELLLRVYASFVVDSPTIVGVLRQAEAQHAEQLREYLARRDRTLAAGGPDHPAAPVSPITPRFGAG